MDQPINPICSLALHTYGSGMRKRQRNIIIVVASGLCIFFVLRIPSIQTDNGTLDPQQHDSTAFPNANSKQRRARQIDGNDTDVVTNKNRNNNTNNWLDDDRMADIRNNNVTDDATIDEEADVAHRKLFFNGPTNDRQRAVVAAAKHAWSGYKKYAWGHDQLKPIAKGFHDVFGLGWTIIDSLDTLYILNMREEFDEARNWTESHLKLDVDRDINLFEVTIRVLGGLLSAYHLSADKMFLTKATELGNRLMQRREYHIRM